MVFIGLKKKHLNMVIELVYEWNCVIDKEYLVIVFKQ